MKKLVTLLPLIFVVVACSHGNCKSQKTGVAVNTKASEVPVAVSSSTDRVKVYKPDGSLQCGQGKQIPLAEMQKQLKGIQVFSSANKNDGMMRIQVCGSPTGNHNVYEIDRKDLDVAIKAGFKEWTFE